MFDFRFCHTLESLKNKDETAWVKCEYSASKEGKQFGYDILRARLLAGGVSICYARIHPGLSIPGTRRNYIRDFTVLDGEAVLDFVDGEGVIKKGDSFLVAPNNPLRLDNIGKEALYLKRVIVGAESTIEYEI